MISNAPTISADGHEDTRAHQIKWIGFLLVGMVLIACGTAAALMPAQSTRAATLILGGGLAVAGIIKIAQALQVKEGASFVWQTLLGLVELVGGLLIFIHPLKGAIALALLIAFVFLVQGIAQVGLALKIRPQPGWGWLLISALVAFAVSGALLLRLPNLASRGPASIAAISLVVGGIAYLLIAYAARKAKR